MQRYRTLWISDVHLGTRDCKASQLNQFLKQTRAEKIYLVGDIIDGWKMKSGVYWRQDFTRVLRRLLTLSKRGVKIDYITGNHDEFLRRFANNRFDNIHLYNRVIHKTADGRRILVIHGDQFDSVARCHQWLKFLGDKGNDLLMFLNRGYNRWRQKSGHGYWSLAGYLKNHIPQAQRYIRDYEEGVAYAAEKQGFDGVICGHIHQAAVKRIGKVDYYNTGDWVESCTALAEDFDGKIHLLRWNDNNEQRTEEQQASQLTAKETTLAAACVVAMTAPSEDIELELELARLEEDDDLDQVPALIIPAGF